MAGENTEKEKGVKKKKSWLVTVLKTVAWFLAGVVLLLILFCSALVWFLTPEKLTPMVERYANDYLNAEVKVERVELTFWGTFPKMTVDVDNLQITSRSLDSIPEDLKSTLPADADSLFSIKCFNGSLNVLALLIGDISLYDVTFDTPKVNLVKVDELHTNYDIIPASESSESSEEVSVPNITINQFLIKDAEPIRYRSLSDSLDVAINIDNVLLNGKDAPCYNLKVEANGKTPMLGFVNLDNLPISLTGAIDWNRKRPLSVALNDFTVTVDSLQADVSASMDFKDSIGINELTFTLNEWDVNYLLHRAPEEYVSALTGLDTDMKINVSGRLKQPYVIGDTIAGLPVLAGQIEVPACHIVNGDLQFNKFQFEADYMFDGRNIDASTLDITKLIIDGKAMDVDLQAKVTKPMSDPAIVGNLKAKFDIDKMPKAVLRKFAAYVTGKIDATLKVNMRMSDLDANHFHRLKIDGDVDFDGFRYISLDSVTNLYLRNTCFNFGSGRKIKTEVHTVDSLLTATIEVDTAHVEYESMIIDVNGFKSGLGTRVTREKVDTTFIVPFGGSLSFKQFKFYDTVDSIRCRAKDMRAIASLRRYEGNRHLPQLSFAVDVKSLMTGIKREFAMGIKSGHFDITSHLRQKKLKNPQDTTASKKKVRKKSERDIDDLDMTVDSGLKAVIKKWDIKGTLKAESGGFYTYAMPVRNRLKNIDLTFNTDSVVLRDLNYKMGQSGFVINGTIGNLRRVLLGRRRNNVLTIDFDVKSDTVNINEISRLLLTDASDAGAVTIDNVEDLENKTSTSVAVDSGKTTAFMVPGNIDADIRLIADNVIYTDMMFNDFKCRICVRNKVANIRNLRAKADLGALDLSALYSTMNRDSIQFGIGLKIDRFHLDKMTAIVPALDSLMPLLKNFSGIVNADIAATTQIDNDMNFVMPTLQAAIKLSGDSLVLLDPDTFKMLSKWLIFRNKKRNMIDHISAEMVVENNQLQLFPFMFDIDRYRLGVMGTNDMAMNLNYHISVLKSPLPFKFGINIKGTVDDMKIRLGGAKFKNKASMEKVSIADTTRINLINEIENVFRRSARSPLRLNTKVNSVSNQMNLEDKISHKDSLLMIKEGYIDAPIQSDTINGTTGVSGN